MNGLTILMVDGATTAGTRQSHWLHTASVHHQTPSWSHHDKYFCNSDINIFHRTNSTNIFKQSDDDTIGKLSVIVTAEQLTVVMVMKVMMRFIRVWQLTMTTL